MLETLHKIARAQLIENQSDRPAAAGPSRAAVALARIARAPRRAAATPRGAHPAAEALPPAVTPCSIPAGPEGLE